MKFTMRVDVCEGVRERGGQDERKAGLRDLTRHTDRRVMRGEFWISRC